MGLDESMMEYGVYTTKVRGSDGKVRDLGKSEYLRADVLAVNAWTEKVSELEDA